MIYSFKRQAAIVAGRSAAKRRKVAGMSAYYARRNLAELCRQQAAIDNKRKRGNLAALIMNRSKI